MENPEPKRAPGITCACGCGGVPLTRGARWLNGHCRQYRPTTSYPRIGRDIKVHRLRAERALGHPLPPNAVVHHADGSRRVDAPLVICENQAYHRLLHARMHIQAAGGNPNTDKICSGCRQPLPLESFGVTRAARAYAGRQPLCRPCARAWNASYKARVHV